MTRLRVNSGSRFEPLIGFSRAVRVDDRVWIAGTGPIAADGTTESPGDLHGQTKRCLQIIAVALGEAGASISDVVRTRVMLTSADDWAEAARAHGEVFGRVRPASTFVVVGGFLEPDWLVEIEAEAVCAEQARG